MPSQEVFPVMFAIVHLLHYYVTLMEDNLVDFDIFNCAKISFGHVCGIKALISGFLVKQHQEPTSVMKSPQFLHGRNYKCLCCLNEKLTT